MTGFYRNMSTGDYDEYRDTEEVVKGRNTSIKKEDRAIKTRRKYNPDDVRPVWDNDDYEY